MSDSDTERARETAADFVAVLSAYQLELGALAQGAPGVVPLREAVGAAIARVTFWISDRDDGDGPVSRTRH